MILAAWVVRGCQPAGYYDNEPSISVYLSGRNEVISLPLEKYIIGAVLAEMPASFEPEALKAQAVCARTYALNKIITGKKYPLGADLSDDINSCQAYISVEEYNELNSRYRTLAVKVAEAVQDTAGVIMVYDREPIDALYHSTCGGRTASAQETWGSNVDYLQSVKCEYCRSSKYYETIQVFSWQEINKAAGAKSKVNKIIGQKVTASGRTSSLLLDDQVIAAGILRQQLGLPSTWWKITAVEGEVVICSHGYGHGVGLCQYGSQGMALAGRSYKEILSYYYKNIDFFTIHY